MQYKFTAIEYRLKIVNSLLRKHLTAFLLQLANNDLSILISNDAQRNDCTNGTTVKNLKLIQSSVSELFSTIDWA